jgi:hypothetical protein
VLRSIGAGRGPVVQEATDCFGLFGREVTNGARLLVSAKELLGWKGPDAFGKAGLL